MPDETKQTEYKLAESERMVLLNLGNAVAQRKLAIYGLDMQLEVEQRERDTAEARFSGALSMIAESHGIHNGQIAPDFSIITEQK